MYQVYERLGVLSDRVAEVELTLELDHIARSKGRIRAQASDNSEVRIFLERGKTLAIGEILKSQCGTLIKIVGQQEPVIKGSCDDWFTFSKACYHLGNRHVKMQIDQLWIRITPDHVLEELMQTLGLETCHEKAVFEPESGAYSHGHQHH